MSVPTLRVSDDVLLFWQPPSAASFWEKNTLLLVHFGIYLNIDMLGT